MGKKKDKAKKEKSLYILLDEPTPEKKSKKNKKNKKKNKTAPVACRCKKGDDSYVYDFHKPIEKVRDEALKVRNISVTSLMSDYSVPEPILPEPVRSHPTSSPIYTSDDIAFFDELLKPSEEEIMLRKMSAMLKEARKSCLDEISELIYGQGDMEDWSADLNGYNASETSVAASKPCS